MKIPLKITPDNLKDTIIEIRFNLNLAPELVLGILYQVLCNKYQYIQPNILQSIQPVENNNPANNLVLGLKPIGLFADENIKIQIQENSIVFNSMDKYLGWEKYFQLIQEVLKEIIATKIIHSFNRVGVRYISQYENISIFSKINGNVILFKKDFEMDNSTIRTEYFEEEKRIIVNLSNNIKNTPKQAPNTYFSLIDIDVISYVQNSLDLDLLFKTIDSTHFKQKEIFFKLIDDNFLKTFNPEY